MMKMKDMQQTKQKKVMKGTFMIICLMITDYKIRNEVITIIIHR